MCSCISPMVSRILNSLCPVDITLIFGGTLQIIVQPCQIAAPNDISSAADNVILKNRSQNIECSFNRVARSAVLLKPNILIFHFCEQKFVQHGPITIAINSNSHTLLIFEEKWPDSASGPISVPNSDSFWVRRLFNVCARIFCDILLVFLYSPRSKWVSYKRMIFFF